MSAPLPRIAVVATGGTIAGSTAASTATAYRAGVIPAEALLAAVPDLNRHARLHAVTAAASDSVEFDVPDHVALATRLAEVAASGETDGIVVTHGTDTMEEAAFAAHLLLSTDVPVVFTGAMSPADAPGADGPANLRDAVILAGHPDARGLGVLVTLGGVIHAARHVRKRHTTRHDAFGSDPGPIGDLVGAVPRLAFTPRRRGGGFAADHLPARLPDVAVVPGHARLPGSVVDELIDGGAAGVVHVGPGAGNVASAVLAALDRAHARGVPVVRTSRVGAGWVARDGAVADTPRGFIAAGDLPPGKARLLLTLGLTRTTDPAALQHLFDTC